MDKINTVQKAYLTAREYALLRRDNESSTLMIIAQENLIHHFLNEVSKNNPPYRKYSAKYIMKFAPIYLKEKITELAIKYNFQNE